jgi:hypothetical protein
MHVLNIDIDVRDLVVAGSAGVTRYFLEGALVAVFVTVMMIVPRLSGISTEGFTR